MYTQCPECSTVFSVSPTDLRLAEGHVRCGNCRTAFDALKSLSVHPPLTRLGGVAEVRDGTTGTSGPARDPAKVSGERPEPELGPPRYIDARKPAVGVDERAESELIAELLESAPSESPTERERDAEPGSEPDAAAAGAPPPETLQAAMDETPFDLSPGQQVPVASSQPAADLNPPAAAAPAVGYSEAPASHPENMAQDLPEPSAPPIVESTAAGEVVAPGESEPSAPPEFAGDPPQPPADPPTAAMTDAPEAETWTPPEFVHDPTPDSPEPPVLATGAGTAFEPERPPTATEPVAGPVAAPEAGEKVPSVLSELALPLAADDSAVNATETPPAPADDATDPLETTSRELESEIANAIAAEVLAASNAGQTSPVRSVEDSGPDELAAEQLEAPSSVYESSSDGSGANPEHWDDDATTVIPLPETTGDPGAPESISAESGAEPDKNIGLSPFEAACQTPESDADLLEVPLGDLERYSEADSAEAAAEPESATPATEQITATPSPEDELDIELLLEPSPESPEDSLIADPAHEDAGEAVEDDPGESSGTPDEASTAGKRPAPESNAQDEDSLDIEMELAARQLLGIDDDSDHIEDINDVSAVDTKAPPAGMDLASLEDSDDAPRDEAADDDIGSDSDDSVIEEIVLETLPDVEETMRDTEKASGSLEFDLPEEEWERVFASGDATGAADEADFSSAERGPEHWVGESLARVAWKRPRRTTILWGLAALALLVALPLQLIHHSRQELVTHPSYGSLIDKAYDAVGVEVTPPWDLSLYRIEFDWTAPDPAGRLPINATLLNTAPYAQPYPLIRLVMTDRWDELVGMLDLEPREYLAAAPEPGALLEPNRRVAASFSIVDPGPEATGFELDVCLRMATGQVLCARDTGT